MKMIVPMQRPFWFFMLCLFVTNTSWAQEIEIIARPDCAKVPCFTKSAVKKVDGSILPPDWMFTFMVNSANVRASQNNPLNLGGELRFAIASKRSVQISNRIVADEQYAKDNNLENPVLYQETISFQNRNTPYYEIGARLTNLNFESLSQISGGRNFQLQYIDIIPAAMRYDLGQRFSLGVGTSFSMLSSATLDGREVADLERSGFNRWEPGLMFNLQYGKRGKGLQAGITYNQRFSYLNETSLRYGITQFSLGWGFGGRK